MTEMKNIAEVFKDALLRNLEESDTSYSIKSKGVPTADGYVLKLNLDPFTQVLLNLIIPPLFDAFLHLEKRIDELVEKSQ